MCWAEVIKINSDMSTPINEFIENSLRLYNSSDIVLYSILSQRHQFTAAETSSNYTISKRGTITICCSGTAANNSYGHGMELNIFKNGVLVNRLSWTGYPQQIDSRSQEVIINVEKNDVISFSWTKDQYVDTYIGPLYIGGFVGWGADIIMEGVE